MLNEERASLHGHHRSDRAGMRGLHWMAAHHRSDVSSGGPRDAGRAVMKIIVRLVCGSEQGYAGTSGVGAVLKKSAKMTGQVT